MRSRFRIPILLVSVALLLIALAAVAVATDELVLGREDDVIVDEGQQLPDGQTISLEEAIVAAQNEASGPVDDVEIERYGDLLVYDIEVGSTDVIVNAQDGSIIAVQTDQDDDDDRRGQRRDDAVSAAELENLISVEDAIAAARNVATGTVHEVELEHEDGLLVYSIEIGQHEVEIDAYTADLVKVEVDD